MLLIQKPAFDVIGVEEILLREEKRIHWVSRSAGTVSYTHLDVYKRQLVSYSLLQRRMEMPLQSSQIRYCTIILIKK